MRPSQSLALVSMTNSPQASQRTLLFMGAKGGTGSRGFPMMNRASGSDSRMRVQRSSEFLEPLRVLRREDTLIALLLQGPVLIAAALRRVGAAHYSQGLSVPPPIEAEGRLSPILNDHIALSHGAPREELDGVDGAIIGLGDGDDLLVGGPAELGEDDLGDLYPRGQPGAPVPMEGNKGLQFLFRYLQSQVIHSLMSITGPLTGRSKDRPSRARQERSDLFVNSVSRFVHRGTFDQDPLCVICGEKGLSFRPTIQPLRLKRHFLWSPRAPPPGTPGPSLSRRVCRRPPRSSPALSPPGRRRQKSGPSS